MARTRNTGVRLARHTGNVVNMLEGAREVATARLSPEAALTRGAAATSLEYARMVPEKALAFSASQAALWQGSAQMMQRVMDYSFHEMSAYQALLRSGMARGPAGWATAQMEWMTGASLRASRFWTQFGAEAMEMSERSLRPVGRTVASNRGRLF